MVESYAVSSSRSEKVRAVVVGGKMLSKLFIELLPVAFPKKSGSEGGDLVNPVARRFGLLGDLSRLRDAVRRRGSV